MFEKCYERKPQNQLVHDAFTMERDPFNSYAFKLRTERVTLCVRRHWNKYSYAVTNLILKTDSLPSLSLIFLYV